MSRLASQSSAYQSAFSALTEANQRTRQIPNQPRQTTSITPSNLNKPSASSNERQQITATQLRASPNNFIEGKVQVEATQQITDSQTTQPSQQEDLKMTGYTINTTPPTEERSAITIPKEPEPQSTEELSQSRSITRTTITSIQSITPAPSRPIKRPTGSRTTHLSTPTTAPAATTRAASLTTIMLLTRVS